VSAFGRLLIVDDEKPVLDVLTEYFSTQGHEVEWADRGPAAIEKFSQVHPDLVMLDVRMPGMDGVEVLKRLRALAPAVPIIMVTANEDVALARQMLKLGAFDYVSKPFDFAHLDRVVTAALLQADPLAMLEAEPAATPSESPLRALVVAVFRASRAMSEAGRATTGRRLEDAALGVAGDAGARPRALAELELLLDVAGELGDLTPADRDRLAGAVAAARAALTGSV
jgi:DNA-binding response OmpR family regulator